MTPDQKRGIQAAIRYWCQSPEFRNVVRYVDSANAGHGDHDEVMDEILGGVRKVLEARLKTVELPLSAVR